VNNEEENDRRKGDASVRAGEKNLENKKGKMGA